MVVSEISTARRGIVFGVFQCCATGITDGRLPRVVFESYSARRKDSIEKSILNWKKKNGPSILLDFSYARVWITWFQRFASYLRSNGDDWTNEEIVAKVPLRVRQVGKLCVFARSDRHLDKNSAKFNYASRRIDIARYLFVPVF